MRTNEFQRQFNSGALGDDMDWFEWDAIADMSARLEDKLALFQHPSDVDRLAERIELLRGELIRNRAITSFRFQCTPHH